MPNENSTRDDVSESGGIADALFSPIYPSAFGFDRIHLWLDCPELPMQQTDLERHCGAVEVRAQQMPYNARWKCAIELRQPSLEALILLRAAVGHDVSVLLTYGEIALDFLCDDEKQANAMAKAFLRAAKMRYQREVVTAYDTTYYFGRRSDANGKRQGHVLAVYADRKSKLAAARKTLSKPKCLHIEWRASGSASLAKIGLVSLDDLINFCHCCFWQANVRMYESPRKTELGQMLHALSGSMREVSDTAHRKRANAWLNRHAVNDHFVLHNGLAATPGLHRKLRSIPFWQWASKNAPAQR